MLSKFKSPPLHPFPLFVFLVSWIWVWYPSHSQAISLPWAIQFVRGVIMQFPLRFRLVNQLWIESWASHRQRAVVSSLKQQQSNPPTQREFVSNWIWCGHQRVDIPANARTAEKGLLQKRLEEVLCWIITHVPPESQSVRGLKWTEQNKNLTFCQPYELT